LNFKSGSNVKVTNDNGNVLISADLSAIDPDSTNAVLYDGTTKDSVTLGGKTGTTITNLKDGDVSAKSSDAINGSQLYETNQNVTNVTNKVDAGWELQANGTKLKDVTPDNKVVSINGSKHITVTGKSDGNITVSTDLSNISADETNAVLYDSLTKGKVTLKGEDGTTITNLKAGVNPTDAVNVSQLTGQSTDLTNKGLQFAANSGDTVTNKLGSKVTVKGGGTKADTSYSDSNIKTKVSQDNDGNTVIDVMMDKDITADSIKVGKDGQDGVSITGPGGLDGKDGLDGKVGITGADGKDAVSISGEDGVGHIGLTGPKGEDGSDGVSADISVKNGDPGVDGKDGITRIVYEDKDGEEHQVATLDDGMKYSGDSGDQLKLKLNQNVNIKGGVTDATALSDNNIGVVSDGTDTLTVKLAKNLTGLESITFGDGSGTAATTVSIGTSGLNNGGNKITNVGAGEVSKTSTDAVNGSQLNEVRETANKGWNLTTSGDTTTSTNVAPGATVDISGANSSVVVSNDGTNVKVGLSDKVTIGTGDNAVSIDGTNGTLDVGKEISMDGKTGDASFGKVDINGAEGTIGGLTNTTWAPDNYTSGQAATEDQLKAVSDAADQAAETAKKHSTVTVNNGKANGSLVMNTSENENGGTNYDISLGDEINVGGTNGKDGSIGVNGKDGTNGVTITAGEGGDGHIGLNGKDGSSANISVKDGAAGVNGKDGETMTRVVYEDKDGTTHTTATLDDGMKYSGDTGDQLKMKLNENVNIKGGVSDTSKLTDGNIGVVSDGNDTLTVKLGTDLTGLNSVTTNTLNATTINSDTIKAGDTITINNGGIDMGDTKITNLKAGDVYEGSTDAVTGGQLYDMSQNVNKLGSGLNKLDNRVNKVGAGAAALAALHPLDFDPDDKWDFAAGYGNYRNANAVAVGAFYRPNEDTMFSIGGSFGNGENMVNAGVSLKIGGGNHVSTSRVAMAKEMKDMRAEMETMRKQMINMAQGGTLDMTKMALFPDIPENHWAYDAIKVLAGNGVVEGYKDGQFKGDRMMTRYEFAMIVYRAMQKGADVNARLLREFEPELERIRVDTISKDKNGNPDIQRVRVIKNRG
jgi:autotransporter adhesin